MKKFLSCLLLVGFLPFLSAQVPAPLPIPIPTPAPVIPPVKKVRSEDDPVTEVVVVPPVEALTWQKVEGVAGLPVTLTNKSGKAVYWLLIDASPDANLTPVNPDADGKTSTAVFGGKYSGLYRVLAVGLTGAPARIAVSLTGTPQPPDPGPNPPPPGPGPGPGPIPPPPPPPPNPGQPVKKFVVVEDTLKAGQWRGNLLGSPAFATLLQQDGLKYRIIDKNAPEEADQEAKLFLTAVQGKDLPWLFTFDAAGNQIENVKCPTDSVENFMSHVTGQAPHKRAMGNRPPPAKKYAWKQFGAEPNVPVIKDRTQWKTVDLSAFLPPVHDQDGRGQCNASDTCTMVEASRKMAGLPYVYLSAGDLYSQINGGRDDGSTLEDALFASMNTGVATVASVPYVWDGKNHGNVATVQAERKLYVVLEAYECPNFDAMASALQLGFFISEGLLWYDNFTPDRDGWLPTRGAGGNGGHALCGFGLVQRNGVWGIRTRNSWSASWGKGGNCIIPESLFGQQIGGFWAVRAVRQTGADFPVTPKAIRTNRDPFAPDRLTTNVSLPLKH